MGTEGQLLLWTNSGLDEWMFALREAVNRSKGRREALRKSQTLLPSMTGGGIWNRYVVIYRGWRKGMPHTLVASSYCKMTI